jgi:PAS domain S-box-containing protein
MKKVKIKIGQRIFGGFLILILIFIINTVVSFVTVDKVANIKQESSEIVRPSMDVINEFILLVTQSKMLATNWVYLQSNDKDKQALKDLHNTQYPDLKGRILLLQKQWDDENQKQKLDSIFEGFDELLAGQVEIMDQLNSFDAYEDAFTKFFAEDAIDSKIIPLSATLIESLEELAADQQAKTIQSDQELTAAMDLLKTITLVLAGVIIIIGLLFAYLMAKSITVPINYIREIVVKLGKGELVEDKSTRFNNDEIGEMAAATDNLVQGLRSTTLFAENIGKGVYDSEFKPLSEEDVLGNALINMRNNLKRVAEEDKKRNWATEGLARFGELLRKNNDNVERLSEDIITNLVKYLKSNQGALFIIDDTETSEEQFMTMTACYAWDKKKYMNQQIFKGEGLAGQVWQEGDTVYLTDVPDSYITITSGLGDANPKSILIVPLKINDDIYGVVEVASFNEFEQHEIEFVEKIAESIASTISAVKINARTTKLLEESTMMTEQLRAQEEEMRQNMEELQATQESIEREVGSNKAIIEGCADGVLTLSTTGVIEYVNPAAERIWGWHSDEVVGKSLTGLLGSKYGASHDALVDKLRDLVGVCRQIEIKTRDGRELPMLATISDARAKGAVKITLFVKEINVVKRALEEV